MAVSAHLWFLFLAIAGSFSVASSDERVLVIGQSTAMEIVPSSLVRDSPGSKPGSVVVAERVRVDGLPRMKNLDRYFHKVKVKVSYSNSSLGQPNVEVCFHKNSSIALGMCPQGQWDKFSKGSWVRTMSPFDNRILDVRAVRSSSVVLEITLEEEFLLYRLVLLILGIVLMIVAPTLSRSLVFYYGSAMAVGIMVVILVVLFQGMKLLPTGRRNSLAVLAYSSIAGVSTFILGYLSTFLRALLVQIGVSEDMYNPLAIFLLLFIVLAGAWMGFWTVRKFILTEDGSIDTSVAQFVALTVRISAAVMILQSSLDALLAAVALICTAGFSMLLRWATRPIVLRRLHKKLLGSVESSPWNSQSYDSSPSGFANGGYEDRFNMSQDNVLRRRAKQSPLATCNSSERRLAKSPGHHLSDSETYYSSFHGTPKRRKYSKEEWDKLTRDHTKKALEELVSSPDFSKWAVANAERITLTPIKKDSSEAGGWRSLFNLAVVS
ncbi:hypothetical protein Dimus_017258 [Dionaea muscipula]